MELLLKQTAGSVDRYFNVLSKLGNMDYKQVEKLMILIFISEIIDGSLVPIISDEDYRVLNNCLTCLYGTCLIPYPIYVKNISLPTLYLPGNIRITEDSIFKHTENYTIRSL